jgi:hypothetical protein
MMRPIFRAQVAHIADHFGHVRSSITIEGWQAVVNALLALKRRMKLSAVVLQH